MQVSSEGSAVASERVASSGSSEAHEGESEREQCTVYSVQVVELVPCPDHLEGWVHSWLLLVVGESKTEV